MYSDKINQAIQHAATLHKDQVRKGDKELPYITHLVAVAMLAAEHTDDEAVVVGALLHDTIEDTSYTPEELRADFGELVHDIVMGVTEPADENGQTYTWKERKTAYANHLKQAPHGSLVVAAADKIHNMGSIIDDYKDNHERFVREFGGSLSERIAMYQAIADTLNERLDNSILHAFNNTFTQYKAFIQHVQETQQAQA